MESSDYGSGSTSNSPQSWSSLENWTTFQQMLKETEHSINKLNRTSSAMDLVSGMGTLDDVMRDFKLNGSDSPYEPDDKIWSKRPDDLLVGMGPASAYLRQKSWPAPERTPAPRLPRAPPRQPTLIPQELAAREQWNSRPLSVNAADYTPVRLPYEAPKPQPMRQQDVITQEQLKVLSSLPNTVLYSLLRELEHARDDRMHKKDIPQTTRPLNSIETECRFCKNNGERSAWYRGHSTRDVSGRVTCPVLRRYVCARCGAAGDSAHTAKYCPLATNEERLTRTAMMRSVRLASGRRRFSQAPSIPTTNNYLVYEPNTQQPYNDATLDPVWAALEQKLMM